MDLLQLVCVTINIKLILIIFFILVSLGIVAYVAFSQGEVDAERQEALIQRAQKVSTRVSFLPELLCSKGPAEAEGNCIDRSKLESSQKVFDDNKEYYFNYFSYATIEVEEIYPKGNGTKLVLYNHKPGKVRNIEPTRFPVTLRETMDDGSYQYSFGYLLITAYGK